MRLSLLICTIVGASMFNTPLFSQVLQTTTQNIVSNNECGFDSRHRHEMLNNTVYKQRTDDFEIYMRNNDASQRVSSTDNRVPVVVHVMETGNVLTELSDAQIRGAIQAMNERYRKIPGTAGDGNGVDATIEFVLAVRDPSGNCTDGIVRIDMTGNATYMASGVMSDVSGITDASLKAISVWNQTEYYNIWIVSEIDNNNGGSGIQGYAYFASSHGFSNDGTVVLANNFKDYSSTTGVHELGHAFNLYHTFEGDGSGCPTNGNCNADGDRVCDTPPHTRSSSDCVIGTNPCTGTTTEEFIHNYLDYSADYCQDEFTAGQRTRMVAALTSTRASFLEINGNMSLVPPSIAAVDFSASNSFVCIGNDFQMVDLSSCTPNTFLDSTYWSNITFSWTITDGVNSFFSTLQNPNFSIGVAGVYDVTLEVTNSFGTNSLTKPASLVVGVSPVGACAAGSSNTGNFANTMNNVVFNTISNSTSTSLNGGYTDFSCAANTVVAPGVTYPMEISLRAGGSAVEIAEVYIDYNNNGLFEAGELVLSGTTGATNTSTTVIGNVTIPLTAVENTLLRMRVYGEAGTLTNNERTCASNLFIGDVEDYGVYIMPTCIAPVIATQPTNQTGCENSNVTYSISNTGTATLVYYWEESTNGGGSWNTISNGGVYSNATTSSLTLSGITNSMNGNLYRCNVSNGCGSDLSSSATLTVNANPVINEQSTSNPVTCATATGSIQVGGSGSGDISWSGSASGSANGITLPYTIPNLGAGNYVIDFISSVGCNSNTINSSLIDPGAPAAPTISTSGSTTFCQGNTVTLTSSEVSGILWSTGESTQSIVVSTSGSYSVTFTDGGGCSSISLVEVVTVNPLPSAPVISAGGATAICQGNTVTLSSSQVSGNTWSTTETTQNIVVTSAGDYTVQYTDGNGCISTNSLITSVTTVNSVTLPLVEGFTAVTFPPTNWNIIDAGGPGDWIRSGTIGNAPSAGNSMQFDNFTNDNRGSDDEIRIEPLTFQSQTSVTMTFDVAYAQYNGTFTDGLEVLVSTDCGTTFSSVYLKNGTVLATDPDITSAYSPGTWRNETIDLSLYDGQESVIISFKNLAGYGNNIYIDNINITGILVCVEPDVPTLTSVPSVCDGEEATINISGNLNDASDWQVYTSSCGGTQVTSSNSGSVLVTPTGASTTYYIRGEGNCAASGVCESITIDVDPLDDAAFNYSASNYCVGDVDPTATISGLSGGSFSSTPGLIINTLTGLIDLAGSTPGTYAVLYTTNGSCVNSSTQDVTITAIPAAPVVTVVDNCGTSTLTTTGTNLVWSTTETTPSIIVGTGGSYTVTQTIGGCTSVAGTGVANPITIPTAPVVTVVDNCGSTTLTTTGTNLVWSTTETTPSITVGTGGSYTVTQTVNGCTSLQGAGVANPTTIPSAPIVTVVDNCGTSTLTTTGTDLFWSTTETTPSITVGTGGSYTVTQTISGCTSLPGTGVANPGVTPSTPIVTVVDNCGSSTLTATGTNLVWSTTETTPSITVGTGGSFTVTQTVGGCTSLSGTGVASPTAIPTAPAVTVVDNCGSSTLTATGSNLVWSTTETTPSITVTTGGTYTVTQTIGGCSSTNGSGTAAPVAIPNTPVVTVVDGCGASTLTTSGTNLLWSTSETTTSIGVTIPGTYSVTQTVSGCTSLSGSIFANPSPPLFITLTGSTGPTVCSGSDGTITINGSSTGTIYWNGAMTGSTGSVSLPHTLTGLIAGSYTITFDDGICTSNLLAESIIDPTPPATPVVTIVNNCGSSTLTTSGSNLLWSTAETTPSINVSAGGVYTVTQSVDGCISAIGSGTAAPITIPNAPVVTVVDNCDFSTLSTSGTNLVWSTTETTPSITVTTGGTYTVAQTVDGCISANGSGTAAPISIPNTPVVTVVDGCGASTLTASGTNLVWSTTETTPSITVGSGGPFTVTQTIDGCTSLLGTGIASPSVVPIISEGTISTPSVCGDADGAIQILGSGSGTISWTGTTSGNLPGQNLPSSITGLGAGNYSITFDDGCTSNTINSMIVDPLAPSAPVVTVVDNCGSSTLTAIGTNLVWSTTETTPSITVTTGGTYTVTQTVGGCISTNGSGTATPIAIPNAPIVTVLDNCGSSSLTATGTNLVWSTTETTPSITVTAGGAYTVTQTVGGCISANGSEIAAPISIPSAPILTVIDNCGSSTLTASGTNLVWSTTETTPSINVTSDGTYTVTQTVGGCVSANGSEIASPIAIPSAPIVTVVDNCGSSTLTASGTNLVWSTTETTPSINVTSGGTYTVTQTVGGCVSANGSGTVAPIAIPSAPIVTVGDNCGSSTLTASGTNLVWSTTETTPSITVTSSGTYTVTQTVGGCVSSNGSGMVAPIAIPSAPIVTVVDNCGSSTLTASGTNLVWSTTETTPSITVTSGGTYTVTQTVNGCESSPGSEIANPISLPVVTFADLDTVCLTSSAISLLGGLPNGGDYSGPSVMANLFDPVIGIGTYTLTYTFTDGNGCSNSANSIQIVDGCAGIEGAVIEFVSVYPNPANDLITIAGTDVNISSILIFDATGRLVYSNKTKQFEKIQIDVSEFSHGVYHLEIKTDNSLIRKRLIKN